MSGTACKHPDIRKFDGIRCCLACGEAVLETLASNAIEKNVDATGRHVYTHLNYQLGQEVRLILLAPGGAADPLCCEIVHVNLEDDPEYDAVSYTWATEDGNADMSKTIDCFKGGYIPITTNCDAVLRQLRRPGTRRRLWIDAICTLIVCGILKPCANNDITTQVLINPMLANVTIRSESWTSSTPELAKFAYASQSPHCRSTGLSMAVCFVGLIMVV